MMTIKYVGDVGFQNAMKSCENIQNFVAVHVHDFKYALIAVNWNGSLEIMCALYVVFLPTNAISNIHIRTLNSVYARSFPMCVCMYVCFYQRFCTVYFQR